MPDLKFMANLRLTIALGLVSANPFAVPSAPTVTECNALLNAAQASRINGYSFGLQASQQTDDRSFADSPSAQVRGFNQFGGDVPMYLPTNYTDTSDILQKVWALTKNPGVGLWVVTRLGAINSTAFAAGDFINVYRVLTDGGEKNTEGVVGGVAVLTFLAQGDVYPLAIVAPVAPVAITVTGPTVATIGKAFWFKATYQGINVTSDCTWTSADTTKAYVANPGMAIAVAAGSVVFTASFPGATPGAAAAVTVS